MPAPPDDPLQPLPSPSLNRLALTGSTIPDVALNNDYVAIKSEPNSPHSTSSHRPGKRSWTPH